MSTHVLVPLKRLDRAKSRLTDSLSPAERAELMRTLLDGVLEAVKSASVAKITLVTSEPIVDLIGVEIWHDRDLPWNVALEEAMREVVREEMATIISADLPSLVPGEVKALIAATPAHGIAIARAENGGTNAVSMRPPALLRTQFGEPSSAGVHARSAQTRGLEHVIVDLPGLAFDVDTPEDLARIPQRREKK